MAKTRLYDFMEPNLRREILPTPTDSDYAWARANPGKWRYLTDPNADKSAIRKENVLGGWLADDNGGFAEQWVNPEFIPVPESIHVEFTNDFELVLWRAIRGFNNIAWFIEAFSRSEFTMVLAADDPQGQRGWPFLSSKWGRTLDIYTSPVRLPKDVNPWLRRVVPGRELLEQVCPQESVWLSLNPGLSLDLGGGLLSPTIPGSDLTDWWREWSDAEHTCAAAESDAT
ncbi:hypothetical protein [Nocardia gamkensis]|uniref:Uncharacterized protein n=1 Tax=Nocardia gamkensis TaxID=352869 RepID=A0A7X6L2Y9_9NOCA|nr:hypothetical protein [Nocardia gamkensis]NKY26825.1 hypothetical protein [Nocardia gamkensis]